MRRSALMLAPLALVFATAPGAATTALATHTKKQAEVNALTYVARSASRRRLPGILNPRTHLLVNNTEAVWLSKMDDTGATVKLTGTALSTDAVANLIANLQKTGYFRNVEIDETYQDDQIKDMQAFQFTLNCDKGGDTQAGKGKS